MGNMNLHTSVRSCLLWPLICNGQFEESILYSLLLTVKFVIYCRYSLQILDHSYAKWRNITLDRLYYDGLGTIIGSVLIYNLLR